MFKGKGLLDIFCVVVVIWFEVVMCYVMIGEMDYLFKVFVEDMEYFVCFICD